MLLPPLELSLTIARKIMPKNKPEQPRISAGVAKGIKLKVGEDVRPITDRMKQSLFDLLTGYLLQATILDLYAGSGSLGLEALSRGAAFCTFVENEKEVADLLRENIAAAGFTELSLIQEINVGRFIRDNKETFDLVFCDPPYYIMESFELHKLSKLLHEKSLLILKLPSDYKVPLLKTMPLVYQAKFGQNQLVIVGKKPVA
jgi:16S rRNA (guanine966-N2)-methyltransferase